MYDVVAVTIAAPQKVRVIVSNASSLATVSRVISAGFDCRWGGKLIMVPTGTYKDGDTWTGNHIGYTEAF